MQIKHCSSDHSIAEGYVAKASRLLYYQWKWKEAFDALKTAMELNPGSIPGFRMLSYYYITVGQPHDAVNVLEEAVQIDPLSAALNHGLGNMYIFVDRFDDAIARRKKYLSLNRACVSGLN